MEPTNELKPPTGGRWGLLELLGHRQVAGYLCEEPFCGVPVMHIYIPGNGGRCITCKGSGMRYSDPKDPCRTCSGSGKGKPEPEFIFDQQYGASSFYGFTPMPEEATRLLALKQRATLTQAMEERLPALPAKPIERPKPLRVRVIEAIKGITGKATTITEIFDMAKLPDEQYRWSTGLVIAALLQENGFPPLTPIHDTHSAVVEWKWHRDSTDEVIPVVLTVCRIPQGLLIESMKQVPSGILVPLEEMYDNLDIDDGTETRALLTKMRNAVKSLSEVYFVVTDLEIGEETYQRIMMLAERFQSMGDFSTHMLIDDWISDWGDPPSADTVNIVLAKSGLTRQSETVGDGFELQRSDDPNTWVWVKPEDLAEEVGGAEDDQIF